MSLNTIIITEWAFDSYLDLVGDYVIVSDPKDHKYNYRQLRDDALLLKHFRMANESPKFSKKNFWEHFAGISQELFEMKWHNFGHARVQLRLHVYVRKKDIYLLQGYVKQDANKQKREMIKSEGYANYIGRGQFKFRGELK